MYTKACRVNLNHALTKVEGNVVEWLGMVPESVKHGTSHRQWAAPWRQNIDMHI